MLFQRWAKGVEYVGPKLKKYWGNGTCLLGCFCQEYSRPSVRVVLGQLRRRFVGIESAMGHELGLHLETCGRTIHWQVLNGCWLAPVMVMEGIHLSPWFFS